MEDHYVQKPFTTGPEITFIDKELITWFKAWRRNTFIVKVLGKRVSFKLLETKLHREWKKNGTIKITDLADGYFLVRLSSQGDYRHALFEGPWNIACHYLIVQHW